MILEPDHREVVVDKDLLENGGEGLSKLESSSESRSARWWLRRHLWLRMHPGESSGVRIQISWFDDHWRGVNLGMATTRAAMRIAIRITPRRNSRITTRMAMRMTTRMTMRMATRTIARMIARLKKRIVLRFFNRRQESQAISSELLHELTTLFKATLDVSLELL